jgi:hypothetical protein
MHTYVTTRDLRLVYFDGSSASKLASGSMDIVDLLIWNEFDEGRIGDEYPRIAALCEWGKKWGIDGYVRCVALTYIPGGIFSQFMLFPPRMQMDLWVHSLKTYRAHGMTNAAVR